ncbi:MAG: AEC family transporter [Clostridiales bacterium]|nr:AEC family transporter [Roseburia sp.]MDD7638150.1 AEC family transporter [Clostridiales bacterium]MDY4111285.1 AEC family transporter [Roseburia sp.]
MILLQQMLALFILMIIGYACGKKDILDSSTTKKISWLVVNVANVAMILQAGLDNQNDMPKETLLIVGGLAVAMYVMLILLAAILPIVLRAKKENYGIYRTMLVFSNVGFMGFPLLLALAGTQAVLYAAIFQFLFSFLLYSYGITNISGGKAGESGFQWKRMINPGLIACVIAISSFFAKVDMPDFVDTVLKNLANLTAPLSMLVIGQSFTEFKLKELFTDVRLLVFTAIKMLVIPIAAMLLLKQWVTDATILTVCLVMLSTPVASMSAMLAQQYDGDYELASRGVALTTLLAVVTMPLVSMVVGV